MSFTPIVDGVTKVNAEEMSLRLQEILDRIPIITASGTAPENPEDTDLWIDTTLEPYVLKQWNEVASEWKQIGGTGSVEYTQAEKDKLDDLPNITASGTAPESPGDKDLWIDTTSEPYLLKQWHATDAEWKQIGADVDTSALIGEVVHEGDNTVARPTGYSSIQWKGWVEPNNATDLDTWIYMPEPTP